MRICFIAFFLDINQIVGLWFKPRGTSHYQLGVDVRSSRAGQGALRTLLSDAGADWDVPPLRVVAIGLRGKILEDALAPVGRSPADVVVGRVEPGNWNGN